MTKTNNQNECCKKQEKNGFLPGLAYGLLPHAGCIAFIVFSVLGVTAATALFRPFLLNPYAFYILIGVSFALATLSAIIYLWRHGGLSLQVAGKRWRYLSVLYGSTILVNVLLFTVIFPAATNAITLHTPAVSEVIPSSITLRVSIPCSGHALLISGELQKLGGVTGVKYRQPNLFDVSYDASKTSETQILGLEVFKSYPATVIGSNFGV